MFITICEISGHIKRRLWPEWHVVFALYIILRGRKLGLTRIPATHQNSINCCAKQK